MANEKKCNDIIDNKPCSHEFGILNRDRYQCSGCKKYFCKAHTCEADFLKPFKGFGYKSIENTIEEGGRLCRSCFDQTCFSLSEWEENIFNKKCNHNVCHTSFGITTFKYSCISCGKFYCDEHSGRAPSEEWKDEHRHFYHGERVCKTCLSTKSIDIEAFSKAQGTFPNHPKSSFLRQVAGDPQGEKVAIIVHGIMSDFSKMLPLAKSLVKDGGFDNVLCFNDIAYRGRVNEAKDINAKNLPSLLKKGLNIPGMFARQVCQIGDLPAHVIEGAAQSLHSAISCLNSTNIVLIGHSLGGLVVRCTVESYDLMKSVKKVITLGSPHRLWARSHGQENWQLIPRKNIDYLALLGEDDWVCSTRKLGNYTEDDTQYKNITKVIVAGAGHSTIHTDTKRNYAINIIKAFVEEENLIAGKSDFVLEERESGHYLRMKNLHNLKNLKTSDLKEAKDWITFKIGE